MPPTPVSGAGPQSPRGRYVRAAHRPPLLRRSGSTTTGIARTARLAGLTRPCVLPLDLMNAPYGWTLNRRAGTSPEAHAVAGGSAVRAVHSRVAGGSGFSVRIQYVEACRQPLDPDAVQGFEECRERIGIGRIEGAADRQATQRGVVDRERLVVVAIELIGHRTQRTLLENDFSLEPGRRLPEVGWLRCRRQHSGNDPDLPAGADVQSDRVPAMCGLRRRERADGHRHRIGRSGMDSKGSAIIVRDRERYLPMIDLHQSLGR